MYMCSNVEMQLWWHTVEQVWRRRGRGGGTPWYWSHPAPPFPTQPPLNPYSPTWILNSDTVLLLSCFLLIPITARATHPRHSPSITLHCKSIMLLTSLVLLQIRYFPCLLLLCLFHIALLLTVKATSTFTKFSICFSAATPPLFGAKLVAA